MDNNLFDDLVASIKEAGAIKRNEMKASRVTELELPDIKEVREKTGLTQAEFAARLHISARTLQNWLKNSPRFIRRNCGFFSG